MTLRYFPEYYAEDWGVMTSRVLSKDCSLEPDSSIQIRVAVFKSRSTILPVELQSPSDKRDLYRRLLGSFTHHFDSLHASLGRVDTNTQSERGDYQYGVGPLLSEFREPPLTRSGPSWSNVNVFFLAYSYSFVSIMLCRPCLFPGVSF